eukprot:9488781-Pyramimonas_sp.AAC.1
MGSVGHSSQTIGWLGGEPVGTVVWLNAHADRPECWCVCVCEVQLTFRNNPRRYCMRRASMSVTGLTGATGATPITSALRPSREMYT